MWWKLLCKVLLAIMCILLITQMVIAISPYISIIIVILGALYLMSKDKE